MGVILGSIAVVILLVLCVSVSFVWLSLKKNQRHREDSGKSVEESEVKTVDFGYQRKQNDHKSNTVFMSNPLMLWSLI